jgi:geranylgeranyl diphosphate synthase type II
MNRVSASETDSAARVKQLRRRVDETLETLVQEQEPPGLYEPIRYVLRSGGKRFRPVLVLLTAEAYGVPVERALPTALAVEVFHNFTLVHDDVMDDAPSRRGQPTVHAKWDDDTALLSGDLLMGLSYDLLARSETADLSALMTAYHRMVTRLCEGQALDTAFETRDGVSVDDYVGMIDCKTAALLQCALELGALLGGASEADRERLREVGLQAGRAFQIQDDLLDLVAEDERWGKAVGGDLVTGKKTYLLLRTLERAEGAEHAWFERAVTQGGLPAEEVTEARERMDRLGVIEEARETVVRHSERAKAGLDVLPEGDARRTLRWLIERMEARLH